MLKQILNKRMANPSLIKLGALQGPRNITRFWRTMANKEFFGASAGL
jgi:hypothetical protein